MSPPTPPIHNHNCLLRRVDATKWDVFSSVDPQDGLILQVRKEKLRAKLPPLAEGEEHDIPG